MRLDRRPSRLARQRMAELHERLGADRRMDLRDPEPVQPRNALERATRLCHDLGPDAVPGEARDRVGRARRHEASSVRPVVVKVAILLGSVTYLLLLSGGPEDAPILWLGRRLRLRGA